MQRKTKIALMAIGACISLVLGTGLISLTSDSVSSTGNSLESGTFQGGGTPEAHDVQAATGGCGGQFSDGPMAAAIATASGTPNVNLDTGSGSPSDTNLCIKNNGSTTGRLRMTVINAVSLESGACQASESSAQGGNDQSCTSGAAGELQDIIALEWVHATAGGGSSESDSCVNASNSVWSFISSGQHVTLDQSLEPGQTCNFRFSSLIESTATAAERQAAQTDRLQFDIRFVLEDV
jgi:hypothetical protein